MVAYRNLHILWPLLLLHVSASGIRFQMFNRNSGVHESAVRLSGSHAASHGRVEVYHNGKWGTVCDDGWGMAEAQVVCRQLNFPGAQSVVIGKDYGQAPGPIWLDDIRCEGTENSLLSCAFKSWGVTDCTHKEDVGVICESEGPNMNISDSTHSLDHSISLSEDLGELFDSGTGCDVWIVVHSVTGNGLDDETPETFCAHKMILSRFPRFNAEGISNITVNVSQTCRSHFSSFLRYIYTRKMDVTYSSVQCLHWLATKFGVKLLMEDTGRLFTTILPEDSSFQTQVSLLEYAMETEDTVLEENCIQYLAWNFQNMTKSPVWLNLSVDLVGALLARSDLVVPDEYYLLHVIEGWILEHGNTFSLETQAELLNHIRFPMIPAEKLYGLEVNSSLYDTLKNTYRDNILKALQFNVLLFNNLLSSPKFSRDDADYSPRIYTAEPWSTLITTSSETKVSPVPTLYSPTHSRRRVFYNGYGGYSSYNRYPYTTVSPYGNSGSTSFSTPVHNSMIFKDKKMWWEANVFTTQRGCSNRGRRCETVPMATLAHTGHFQQANIRFQNQLLLVCQDNYISQIQEFKNNEAYFAGNNNTQVTAYPCPDDQYSYRFVVRPEYVN